MVSARALWSSATVRIAAVTAVVAAGPATGLAHPADAATPTDGSVSDTSPSVQWTGGPFVAPNVTGNALDAPDCTVPSSCDDFTLGVDTPAGYGDTHTLNIKVSWANTAADFDVYV